LRSKTAQTLFANARCNIRHVLLMLPSVDTVLHLGQEAYTEGSPRAAFDKPWQARGACVGADARGDRQREAQELGKGRRGRAPRPHRR
jgi:hypothetical protein